MKEMLKLLGKYKWKVLLVLFLLIIQAFMDLSLPGYTSKIVDVGIAQYGIENNVPVKIRVSEYNKISELIEDKEILDKSYKCSDDVCDLTHYSEELSNMLIKPELILLDEDYDKFIGNESLVNGKLIDYVKKEYEALGIDINDYSFKYIINIGIKMLVFACLVMFLTFLSVYLSSKVMANFERDLRVLMISKVLSFESEEINKFSSASLITRCTNDVMQVSMLVMVFLRIIVYAPILGMGALVKVNTSGVSYLVAVPIILILLVMIILFIVVVPKMKIFQDMLDKLTVVSREILNGIPVIRAFTNEKREEERFEVENNNISNLTLFIDRSVAFLNPSLTFIINSVSILIVWVCSSKIDTGVMGVGEMIAISTYVIQISMAFLMISMVAMMIPRSLVSIKRLSEVINTKVSVLDNDESKSLNGIDNIEFRNVSFRYPNQSGNILENISFSVSKGESIGIIGSTGSGKSSLVNLIPRFYDTTSGNVFINNIDIKEYKISDLRDSIGYVPQKSFIKSGTIKSNICFNDKEDESLIKEVSKMSMSEEFILNKDNQYDSVVSQGGMNLSGGQKQRLSIARAFYKKSSVLILDDSTSALDYKTDASLRKELNKIKKDKIIFVVAQRVSSIMNLDKIIVIDNGKIVGIGNDNELLNTCKIYKEIKCSQLGGEEIGE